MTIQQLEYILDVQRTGSISQTAKNFLVSQSSVSNSINTLEEELGYPIFERSWQGTVPTEDGQTVLAHAARVCEHARSILTSREPKKKELCVATHLHPLFQDAFTKLVRENAGREDVLLSHRSGSAEESIEQVARSRVGVYATLVMVLSGYNLANMKSMRQVNELAAEFGLEVDVRDPIPLVARIGPEHRLYRQQEIALDVFRNETLIDTPARSMANSLTLHHVLGSRPERLLTAASARGRYELTAKGLGYTFGPQYPKALDEQYGFRNIPIPNAKTFLVIVRKSGSLEPEFERYIKLLEEETAAINEG